VKETHALGLPAASTAWPKSRVSTFAERVTVRPVASKSALVPVPTRFEQDEFV